VLCMGIGCVAVREADLDADGRRAFGGRNARLSRLVGRYTS
jgi:hypothetical protein